MKKQTNNSYLQELVEKQGQMKRPIKGIGIKQQIEDVTINVSLRPLTVEDFRICLNELNESHEVDRIRSAKEVSENVKALIKREKTLNKKAPEEVWAVIYANQPQGAWFFERYKEWFNETPAPDEKN